MDESSNIDVMASGLRLNSLRFNGDECWPRNGLESWPQNPNRPDVNLYRLLAQKSYRLASLTGSRVMFTGSESDNSYTGSTEWLYDLLRDGKLAAAMRESLRFASPVRRRQVKPEFLYLSLRRLAGHVLHSRRREAIRDSFSSEEYPWLTAAALDLLNDATATTTPDANVRSLRHQGFFASGIKWLMAAERYFAMIEGIEVRRPYYDRRLVEFMLGVPSYLLYNHGYMKYILREGMRGRLPESIRWQTQRTLYTPLFQIGMQRDRERMVSVVAKPNAVWTKYLRQEWMESELPEKLSISSKSRREHLVGDWCVAIDAWSAFLAGTGVQ